MEPVNSTAIRAFLQQLSERYLGNGTLYLLGGSALCLLGSPRETRDIDYTVELASGAFAQFESIVADLAREMRLDLEAVPLADFIPLPPRARERRLWVGRFGQIDVYIFDLYSVALSKIARGFEADFEDVLFILRQNLINFDELERLFRSILPRAPQADIDPREFRTYFEELRRRVA